MIGCKLSAGDRGKLGFGQGIEAASWRGWEGELSWSTLEGEFKLTATADRLGHIELLAEIKSDANPREWEVKARLNLEAGSLEPLYRSVAAVFPIHANAPAD